MPLMSCQINSQPGYKWGESGKCYPGKSGKAKAIKQAVAIMKSQGLPKISFEGDAQ